MAGFDGVKVFSATKARDRMELGEKATAWITKHKPNIVDYTVRQSSDREFHCLTIIVFIKEGTA